MTGDMVIASNDDRADWNCDWESQMSCLPGVALSHKSRWPKLSKQHANINVLNPGRKTDMAESSAVHSVEVALRKKE